MTELTKGQVLDMTYEYSRPYEIEGLNEISLNLEEEEDNIYRANGDVCDDDSDSDYEGFREFDFDVSVILLTKRPLLTKRCLITSNPLWTISMSSFTTGNLWMSSRTRTNSPLLASLRTYLAMITPPSLLLKGSRR